MRYVLIDEKRGNMYAQEFENKAVGIDAGDKLWHIMEKADQDNSDAFYLLESVNPDEDAADHFDGDIVKAWK